MVAAFQRRVVFMKTIQASDARTHFAELLDAATRGESFALTRHGKVVACIVPAGNAATAPSWRGIAAQPRPENPAG